MKMTDKQILELLRWALILAAVCGAILFVGCANASPLDPLWPARRPSPATTEYLGHLYQTNTVNGMYHSLSDIKIAKALVPIRKMELQGLYYAAKGETELIDATTSAMSNGAWIGISALLGAAGIMIPSPREKGKVLEALHKPPPPR